MEQKISIQVHDYDSCGRYLIIEDRKATRKEVHGLKIKARQSVKPEWDKLPAEATHIVYYAELCDKKDNVWYAAIYMHGEAFNEKDFDRIFRRSGVGYVGAIHKRIPMP